MTEPNITDEGAKVGPLGHFALALSKAQGMIKGAAKDSENPHFKSKYADLASVWEACREALAKNEIAVVQPVTGGPETITISTMLIHSSGESLCSSFTIRPGKADAQGLGSAITYGRRYGLASMVGVAPEDDDGNAASEGKPRATPKAEGTASKAAQQQSDASGKTIFLDLGGGAGSNHSTAGAYLDALESALSSADDPNAVFDLNAGTLQKIQAKALERKDGAMVGRIKAIFDHIHAGTVPGLAAE